ncbi:MAG: hypothetical protein WBH51_01420 [Mycolicibacter algericus]|uniref:hypothetical protein n=1 Tax=Mycolicibacter algericus TaxID=1288388 RepID=UPI003C78F87F
MSANDEASDIFDTIMDDGLKDSVITALHERVDELTKRVAMYESNAQVARHARRDLMRATKPKEVVEAITVMREALRVIHPTTKAF